MADPLALTMEEAKAVADRYNAERQDGDPFAEPRLMPSKIGLDNRWYVDFVPDGALPDHP